MTSCIRFCVTIWFVFAAVSAEAQVASQGGIASVRLSAVGHANSSIDAKWEKRGEQDGLIDIEFGSDFADLTMRVDGPPMILAVLPSPRDAKITVRQRSVSYLNVGDEGPHMAVAGTEQRSSWTKLTAVAPGRFRVKKTVQQKVRLQHSLFEKAFATEPAWLKLAKACNGPDDGACYTVTDPEFEITVIAANGRKTRKIVRVTTPNGC
jgi:hypothetical protein